MAGKNGSTQYTAPMAAEQATSSGEPPRLQQPDSQESRHSAPTDNDPEQQSTMTSLTSLYDLKPPRGMLDRSLQAQLGRQLRAIFADIANEPVPDRFIRLLEALEAREKRR